MTEKNRTIIVTGASSGIGEAICRQLCEQGYTVVGLARSFQKFADMPESMQIREIDFSDLKSLPEKLKALSVEHKEIYALVCCAGKGQFGNIEEFSFEHMQSLMDLNFTSQAYVCKAFLPGMKKQGSGRLVFMGSESALSGGKRGAVYSASKAALRGFAQALREECARSNISVSVINPGLVKTPFFDDLHFEPGQSESNYILPEDVAEVVALIMESRVGTVYDEVNLSPMKNVIQFKKDR